MARILNYIKYELKIFLGEISNMFWMMIFPILLLTFFTITFGGIRFYEYKFEKAVIAYHENSFMTLYMVEGAKDLPDMTTLDKTRLENSLFKGQMMTKEQALEALKTDQIDAYVDKDLNLVISKNGISQMIMDEVIVTAKQVFRLGLPLESYDFNRVYVENIKEKYSSIDLIFYALFAMISLYGAYISVNIGNRLIVRDKTVALRNVISSTPKTWQVMISIVSSFLWSLFMVITLVIYSEFVLKQHFFSLDIKNIPILLAALIFGITWGLFIGTIIEKESTQQAALISSLLIMSGISGFFSNSIEILIQRVFPQIIKYNPVSMISDELIKINMLGNYSTLDNTVIMLISYSIILIIISVLYITRRKKA
jgi:ABC-2 type transport system permease protein